MNAANPPSVELLWWSGCPSRERALQLLHHALAELGLEPSIISQRQVVTQQEADDLDFIGSPTMLVNGRDIVAVDPNVPRGLTCRVYRRRDGRISPLPDPADLLSALRAAM